MTLDGFVAGPNGELDWMWIGSRDEAIQHKVIELAQGCDTILLGRKMTPGFISHWENVVDHQPNSPETPLAKLMVSMQKIVFSNTQQHLPGRNLQVVNEDLTAYIQKLKAAPGKDIMAYGGASFASSLISRQLVDEFYIFRRPVAIGNGLSIFKEQIPLQLVHVTTYKNGAILAQYEPAQRDQ